MLMGSNGPEERAHGRIIRYCLLGAPTTRIWPNDLFVEFIFALWVLECAIYTLFLRSPCFWFLASTFGSAGSHLSYCPNSLKGRYIEDCIGDSYRVYYI